MSATDLAEPVAPDEAARVTAHHGSIRKLGPWTTSRRFDVRATRGSVVLDLLLPQIPAGEIEIDLDLDHATLILLVPDGTRIDGDDVRRLSRGRIKDWTGVSSSSGRTIKLTGEMRHAEVRVHRGGMAILRLMLKRRTRAEVRRAHREGRI